MCPQSSDRVVQCVGKVNECMDALNDILILVKEVPIKGSIQNYDPINYDDYSADKYGGFGGDGGAGGGGNRNNNNNRSGGGQGGQGGQGGKFRSKTSFWWKGGNNNSVYYFFSTPAGRNNRDRQGGGFDRRDNNNRNFNRRNDGNGRGGGGGGGNNNMRWVFDSFNDKIFFEKWHNFFSAKKEIESATISSVLGLHRTNHQWEIVASMDQISTNSETTALAVEWVLITSTARIMAAVVQTV